MNTMPRYLRFILFLLEGLEEAFQNVRRGIGLFRVGLLCEALSDTERSETTIEAYHDAYVAEQANDGLHEWEKDWFTRDLPPAPATLLIAAAGTGREAVALQAEGYRVDVLEPASNQIKSCSVHLPDTSLIVQGTFDDLVGSILDGKETPATRLADNYDAVILGWGGLAHVLLREQRMQLLRACARLTEGPILASFFMDPHAVEKQQAGSMTALGRGLGRAISRLRGLDDAREPVEYTRWGGFLRHFTPQDIDELTDPIDRLVLWQQEGGFPHVTFTRTARP